MSTARGLRLIKALEEYAASAEHMKRWDAANVFRKVKLVSAGDGRLRAHFTVDESMCNSGNSLHGGCTASLVDVIALFGYVSHAKGRVAWTTNLQILYLRKAMVGERVEVEASPLQLHRRGGVMQCALSDARGALLARGTTTLVASAGDAATADLDRTVAHNLRFDFHDEN